MAHRLANPSVCATAVAMLLCGALVGVSARSFAQAVETAPSGQDTESATPPKTPAPRTPANQPPFDPIAARIKYLHERLRITPAQEPLWAKVAEAMREDAKAAEPLIKQRLQSAEHGTAVDALNSYEKLGEVQLDGLKKFIDAFSSLYSSLSPQQKKIADTLFRIGPLSMVGGIPEPAEALIAPAPSYSVSVYPSYALLPPPYPIYRYYPYYPAYSYYPYYPYYRPWFWRPPIGFGARALFFHSHRQFHEFHGVGHRR
jgi:periplasmic protein CpxP/Spy